MSERQGAWTRRMGRALLPVGVALGVLVVVRTLLVVGGWESANPLTIVWVLVQGPSAAFFIWSGVEYRRRPTR